jgi:hypothetical protein
MTDDASKQKPKQHDAWVPETWLTLRTLWAAYHWPTKALMLLLVVLCVWGAYLAGWTDDAGAALPGWDIPSDNWLRALGSDAVRSIVTLAVALAVALATYREISKGLFSGDSHYDVGRAMAYGYLRNFLVIALLVAEQKNYRVAVFRPESIEELKDFVDRLWPNIDQHLATQKLFLEPGEEHAAVMRGLRRTATLVFVDAAPDGEQSVIFDPPSTLMVIQDYYAHRSQRLHSEGRGTLNEAQLSMFQTGQINSFFLQLTELINHSKPERALQEFGVDADRLKRLGQRLDFVSLATLTSRWHMKNGLTATDLKNHEVPS